MNPSDPQDKGRIISELMRIQSGRHEIHAYPPAWNWLVAEGYTMSCGSDAKLTPVGEAKAQQILDAWDTRAPCQGELFLPETHGPNSAKRNAH